MQVTFNINKYKSKNETYKDFYRDICIQLDAKNDLNCTSPIDLNFNIDRLDELLWDYHMDEINFVFVGLDQHRIENNKTYDDYEWSLIVKIFNRFVERYPNNTLEFKDCEENEGNSN